MRAIETRYKGRLFRSRLEARYAVLFDALGIQWDYEPEGFEFSDGTRYLPDFWLKVPDKPGWGYWIEIKPIDPSAAETHKLRLLDQQSGHRGWFLVGTPGEGQGHEVDGAKMAHRWSAPLMVCAPAPIKWTSWERALRAARGARFEFGGRV